MKNGLLLRTAVYTLAYIAIFVIIVIVQFPAAGPFSLSVGTVAVKGVPDAEGEGLRSIEISASGLRLSFSAKAPLAYTDAGGIVRESAPAVYRALDKGVAIDFVDGSTLSVTVNGDGGTEWSVKTPREASAAALRFGLARGAFSLPPAEDAPVRLSLGGVEYQVTGIGTGQEQNLIALGSRNGVLSPFYVSPVAEAPAEEGPEYLGLNPMDTASWNRELSSWRDKAWAGVSGRRFDQAGATWTDARGIAVFDEAEFVLYVAEAMRRERYDTAAALVSSVRSIHLDKISWRSVPFAGRTSRAMAEFEEANLAEVRIVERLVQTRAPELFYRPGIVPFLFDRAPFTLAQTAMGYAGTADFSKADVAQAVRLLEAYLEARNYLSDAENPLAKVVDLVDQVISPALLGADPSGFFLQTGADGSSDTQTGLSAGMALVGLAEVTGKPIHAAMGHKLVKSLLQLADADGALPASVTVTGDAPRVSESKLAASTVYALVGGSPYYPRAISFYRTLGPGSWAWTAAPGFRLTATPERVTFTADYPVGYSHYISLYGVRPFIKIQLYGLDYNMDAGFESYNASGYFFKRASGIMYVKMRHKEQAEEIRMFY
ncbi:MAG: hypothetical protein ABIJ86_00475 [Spirochaetota bacterium]